MVFEGTSQMQAVCTKIVACATVIEETLLRLPPGVDYGDNPFNEYDSLVEHHRGHSRRKVERLGRAVMRALGSML
jgi:hypothetical protein